MEKLSQMPPCIFIFAALILFLCSIYRVTDVNKALIVSGGKETIIKTSGGSFIIPVFRKASYFDLGMVTVDSNKAELKTITDVPIIVDWTAQIRPYTEDTKILKKAVISFKNRGTHEMCNVARMIIMDSMKNIAAASTPEHLQNDRKSFKNESIKAAESELHEMGLKLVSLSIQDITPVSNDKSL